MFPEQAKSVMRYLGCPCEYFPRGTEIGTVVDAYRSALSKEKCTPLLIAVESHMFFDEGCSSDFQKEVFAAPKIDPEWFKKTRETHDRDFCYEPSEIIGEMSGGRARTEFSAIIDYGIQKTWDVVLAKIPTENPWEVFAWLPFGGWNDCPSNGVMLWVGKYWYEKYGAVPAVISGSVLEFTAPRVPKEKAFGLAEEHFAFCPDNVLQNVGTIGRLADELTKSTVWYFRWD
ncbi:MAG: DUF4253 domain-containing protein [Ruminococcaceae bacterium]|nr:DUF4253 domain-containing protein [Oscillospiraceae bacterium]